MAHSINTDDPVQLQSLARAYPSGILPRRESLRYGSREAEIAGLLPVHEQMDVVVHPSNYKEVIAHCHDAQIFPLYHQYDTWRAKGLRYDQNGLGFCWSWSGCAAVMDCRALEDKDTVLLGPVSMGYLVGWRNEGNYLQSFIRGARDQGIAPADYVGGINSHSLDYRNFRSGWDVERAKYRLDAVWDVDNRASDPLRLQQMLSILAYGRPCYVAYNWWGHAVEVVAVKWDESKYQNVVVVIRNSHNEADVIELSGTRCIPDECYGFISTVAV